MSSDPKDQAGAKVDKLHNVVSYLAQLRGEATDWLGVTILKAEEGDSGAGAELIKHAVTALRDSSVDVRLLSYLARAFERIADGKSPAQALRLERPPGHQRDADILNRDF